jgi:hypothetical protein
VPPRRRTHGSAEPGSSTFPEGVATSRTLAEDLRQRSDEALAALLLARPDLARPAPADVTALAARASTLASVRRALERLDLGRLQVLEAVLVAASAGDGTAYPDAVAELLGTDPSDALADLWGRGLIWVSAQGLRPVRAVGDALGTNVAGLGPPYAAGSPPTAADIEALLAAAPAAAAGVLDLLVWGPPTGVVPRTGPGREGADWLVERGLLVRSGATEVTLPREVALARRGGRLHPQARLAPPEPPTVDVGVHAVDAAAGSAARDVLGLLDELAERWGTAPPRVLRAGGLAVRDLTRLATALDVPTQQAAWLVELGYAAGLLADDGELAPVWAFTADFDLWQGRDAGVRWARLARAWGDSARAPHLVGTGVNALGLDTHWPPARTVRAEVLERLAALGAGRAASAQATVEWFAWARPLRQPEAAETAVLAVLREAAWLGVTGQGALGTAGQALVAGADDASLAHAISAGLPPSVEHVLLQADLTAVAPGPFDGELARFLRLVADVESRGAATVLRFSAGSVRRALDAGWSADDVLDMLARSSRTPVPQPLDYLVRDVARRHGQTRVGGATAYVRSDDEAVLAQMLAERALAPALLQRLAPTVLVSRADPATLVDLLRDSGFAPVHEGLDGLVVVAEPTAKRTRARAGRGHPVPPPRPVDPGLTAAIVAAMRAAAPRPLPGLDSGAFAPGLRDPIESATALREAAADGTPMWIGVADGNGRTTRVLVRPTRVEAGRLYAVVPETDRETAYPLHRITGVAPYRH